MFLNSLTEIQPHSLVYIASIATSVAIEVWRWIVATETSLQSLNKSLPGPLQSSVPTLFQTATSPFCIELYDAFYSFLTFLASWLQDSVSVSLVCYWRSLLPEEWHHPHVCTDQGRSIVCLLCWPGMYVVSWNDSLQSGLHYFLLLEEDNEIQQ